MKERPDGKGEKSEGERERRVDKFAAQRRKKKTVRGEQREEAAKVKMKGRYANA